MNVEQIATLTFEVELPGGQDRLRELILYVCDKCLSAERFGKVKLNKIIWRADFQAFEARRTPVTGRSYHRLAAGPAPIEMPLVLEEMRASKLVSIEKVDRGDGYIEDRIRALKSASLRFFSEDDMTYVDEAISFYWVKSTSYASDLSHGVAWKSRKFLDPLPYESVFLSDEKMRPADAERFSNLAKERNWSSL